MFWILTIYQFFLYFINNSSFVIFGMLHVIVKLQHTRHNTHYFCCILYRFWVLTVWTEKKRNAHFSDPHPIDWILSHPPFYIIFSILLYCHTYFIPRQPAHIKQVTEGRELPSLGYAIKIQKVFQNRSCRKLRDNIVFLLCQKNITRILHSCNNGYFKDIFQ